MRLLIITHTYPPSRHSNAKRPFYLAKGALEAGWEVDVMTSAIGLAAGSGELHLHTRLRVFRCLDPVEALQRRLGSRPRVARSFGLACNGLFWPDACAPWARRIFRQRRRLAGYDRVLAFVFPPSVLLAGARRGLVDRRWTFDFQESVSPQFRRFPRRSPLQRLLSRRLERLEQQTLHRAGRVVFTAQSNRQAYLDAGLVPPHAAEHVPYFYDAPAFAGEHPIDPGFEIRYYGNFDLHGDRNPETFLRSLARFLEHHPQARGETRFVFHGNWLPAHDRFLNDLGLHDVMWVRAPLPYEGYLDGLKSAQVLLLVVAEAHNLFMPSKIVDYFGARRPILAFVPAESEMKRVLDEARMSDFVCGERDVEAGARAIERLWEAHQGSRLSSLTATTQAWSSEVLIPRYLDLLESAGSPPQWPDRRQGIAAEHLRTDRRAWPPLLVFAHVPPPEHGQSRMVAEMLRAMQGKVAHVHVNARLSAGIDDVGTLSPIKGLRVFGFLAEALRARFHNGCRWFYFVPGPVKWSAVLRDWFVLACIRPFFRNLIFHWHAIGQGEWAGGSTRCRLPGPPWLDRAARAVSAVALRRPALSIVVSPASDSDAVAVESRRIEVVCNGVDDPCPRFTQEVEAQRRQRASDLMSGRAKELRLLFLSRGTEEKGLFDTLEALGHACAAGVAPGRIRLEATFAGGVAPALQAPFDEVVNQLEREHQHCGLRILCMGYLGAADKARCFRQADLFLSASRWESFGLTVVESMAWGVPVVAAASDGARGVLPADYPWLAPPAEPERLATVLRDACLALLDGRGCNIGLRLRSEFESRFAGEIFRAAIGNVLANTINRLETG